MMAQLAEQPTAALPRIGKQGYPCVMVIFGAAGDLTARMLIPALYNLARANLLSKEFAVLGVARAKMSDEDFRKRVFDDVKEYCGDCIEDSMWDSFSRRFYYFAGDFKDDKLYPQVLEDELAYRFANAARHAVHVLLAFDHARPGDQHQALAEIRKFNRHGRIAAPQWPVGADRAASPPRR